MSHSSFIRACDRHLARRRQPRAEFGLSGTFTQVCRPRELPPTYSLQWIETMRFPVPQGSGATIGLVRPVKTGRLVCPPCAIRSRER
jgi:hypothetical protein